MMEPISIGDMRAIENVQRRTTRLTPSMKTLQCYHDRLVTLDLPSLLYRRRMVYKIVHGLDGIHFEDIYIYIYILTLSLDPMVISYIQASQSSEYS